MKKDYMIILVVSLSAISMLLFLTYQNKLEVTKVINGEYQLYCHLKGSNYFELVNPALVVDRYDDTWVFVNGSAKNCKLIKGD